MMAHFDSLSSRCLAFCGSDIVVRSWKKWVPQKLGSFKKNSKCPCVTCLMWLWSVWMTMLALLTRLASVLEWTSHCQEAKLSTGPRFTLQKFKNCQFWWYGCKKCYYRNKNSKYTNENCVFFDQSVEILDWVQLCLRRCFEDVASAQHLNSLCLSSFNRVLQIETSDHFWWKTQIWSDWVLPSPKREGNDASPRGLGRGSAPIRWQRPWIRAMLPEPGSTCHR